MVIPSILKGSFVGGLKGSLVGGVSTTMVFLAWVIKKHHESVWQRNLKVWEDKEASSNPETYVEALTAEFDALTEQYRSSAGFEEYDLYFEDLIRKRGGNPGNPEDWDKITPDDYDKAPKVKGMDEVFSEDENKKYEKMREDLRQLTEFGDLSKKFESFIAFEKQFLREVFIRDVPHDDLILKDPGGIIIPPIFLVILAGISGSMLGFLIGYKL